MKRDSFRAQMGPFVMVPVWLLDRCKDARAIHLYAILGRYANREGRAWPKRAELAEALGISEKSVQRAVEDLRAAGALTTSLRHRQTDGAILGLDYLLIQVAPTGDPAEVQKDTGVQKEGTDHQVSPGLMGDVAHGTDSGANPSIQDADQTDADVQMAESGQKDTGVQKASGILQDTTGPKAPSHKDKIEGAFRTPVSECTKEEPDPLNQIQEPRLSTPSTDRPSLLDVYHDGFVARFNGTKPLITPGKDGRLMKVLEDSQGYGVVRQLLEWFFRIRDPFISNTGYSVGVFYAVFNRLQLTYRPADPPASEQTALLREVRVRSEKVQAEREAEARLAIVALSPSALEALKKLVTAEMAELYPGIATYMSPESYQKAIKSATVQYVVNALCKGGKSVADVMEQFARSHAA